MTDPKPSGPDLIRAAIERDRGDSAPTPDEMRALTACCAAPDTHPLTHTPPPPKTPLRQRIHQACRTRARAVADAITGKFGYHRESEEDW